VTKTVFILRQLTSSKRSDQVDMVICHSQTQQSWPTGSTFVRQ